MIKINNQVQMTLPENRNYETLEKMIKETLINEFGKSIQDTVSYNLFVETIAHNLKKKQLDSFA